MYLGNRKTYYRNRIILTFTSVSAGIILILIILSNFYVKEIFTEQVKDQVSAVTKLTIKNFDKRYLKNFTFGPPTKSFKEYFNSLASIDNQSKSAEFFIFNKDLQILIHNDSSVKYKSENPFLSLFQDEILKLNNGDFFTSVPFKTKTKNWYLWGFYKFDENHLFAYKAEANRFNKLEDFSSFIIYMAAGSVLLTCLIAFLTAKSITRPINKLVSYCLNIGRGQTVVSIPDKLKGEIKILGESLDKMHKGLINNQNEKEKMLAQIAHEIRNPLGGIELLTSLVKERTDESDKNIEYLNSVLNEIFRLKSLITSFLNYSKPLPANPDWIVIEDVFSELSSFIKNKTTNRNIEFNYNSNLKKIFFDPVHMKQILINLISNSIESIEKEGRISTELLSKDNKWFLKISDTGKGIPEENYSDLFKPFFTTKKDGTGLGLAICKKLCDENNAEILIDKKSENTTILIIKEKSYE